MSTNNHADDHEDPAEQPAEHDAEAQVGLLYQLDPPEATSMEEAWVWNDHWCKEETETQAKMHKYYQKYKMENELAKVRMEYLAPGPSTSAPTETRWWRRVFGLKGYQRLAD